MYCCLLYVHPKSDIPNLTGAWAPRPSVSCVRRRATSQPHTPRSKRRLVLFFLCIIRGLPSVHSPHPLLSLQPKIKKKSTIDEMSDAPEKSFV